MIATIGREAEEAKLRITKTGRVTVFECGKPAEDTKRDPVHWQTGKKNEGGK